MKKTKNTVLFRQLKSNNTKVHQMAFVGLYQAYYPVVFHFVKKNGGNATDAEDVFQEGITVLWQQAKKDLIKDEEKIGAYLYSVCKNIWFSKRKKQPSLQGLSEKQLNMPSPERNLQALYQKEDKNLLSLLLSQLKERYRQILIYFYFEHLPMKEISYKMGFRNEQVAKNTKYRAIQQLKDLVQSSGCSEQLLTCLSF